MEESIAWFLMTGFNSFNLTSVTFLIMVSELPRRIPFQQYTLIRSTRVRWIVAQMLYCLLLVVLMLVVLIALTALMLIPVVVQGKGWSDNVRIAAGEMPELSYVSAWIRQNLTPIQTSLLSIVPIFLFWLTMTWSILLCGLLGYGPQGVILYSVVLMLDTILMVDTPDFFCLKCGRYFDWLLYRILNRSGAHISKWCVDTCWLTRHWLAYWLLWRNGWKCQFMQQIRIEMGKRHDWNTESHENL